MRTSGRKPTRRRRKRRLVGCEITATPWMPTSRATRGPSLGAVEHLEKLCRGVLRPPPRDW